MNSARTYKVDDNYQTRYASSKKTAISLARAMSSIGTVSVGKLDKSTFRYTSVARYRFGRVA